MNDAELDQLLSEALTHLKVKDAAITVALQTGLSRKVLYDRAVRLRNGAGQ